MAMIKTKIGEIDEEEFVEKFIYSSMGAVAAFMEKVREGICKPKDVTEVVVAMFKSFPMIAISLQMSGDDANRINKKFAKLFQHDEYAILDDVLNEYVSAVLTKTVDFTEKGKKLVKEANHEG